MCGDSTTAEDVNRMKRQSHDQVVCADELYFLDREVLASKERSAQQHIATVHVRGPLDWIVLRRKIKASYYGCSTSEEAKQEPKNRGTRGEP